MKMMNLKIGEMKKDQDDEKYWFTKDKVDKIQAVHNYLDRFTSCWKSFII